ncbi:MAG: hypothetical protein FIA99_19680 [Ruminiclostridium sp.]|nr:hypothetical protein [Ruminiclostridium sp.]
MILKKGDKQLKRICFLIIIPLFFIIISLINFNRQFSGDSPESILLKAFADSGAEITSSEITFTGSSINKLETANELKNFYIGITEAMGADKPIIPENIDNEGFEGIELKNENGKYRNYTLRALRSIKGPDIGRCYVTLYIVDSFVAPGLSDIKNKVTGIFKEFGINAGINTCLTGRYEGRLENSRMNEICKSIFKRTAARKVDGIKENNLISVSAYSKSMRESVVVEGKNVNLNFAARYNSYENKTYIWLATPLITTEY